MIDRIGAVQMQVSVWKLIQVHSNSYSRANNLRGLHVQMIVSGIYHIRFRITPEDLIYDNYVIKSDIR